MIPHLVTVAHGPEYGALLTRFSRSAREAGFGLLSADVCPEAPAAGLEVWKRKPRLILDALKMGHPVLWADVDFLFHRRPTFGFAADADAALYESAPGVYEDGVMLWNPTAPALAALSRWDQRCQASADWTNIHLAPALREASANVVPLPPVYHWVERWHMSERYGRREPVIEEVPLCGKPSLC